MKILVIGGTGFIGPHLVRELSQMGHSVSVFHRGSTRAQLPAESILGERRDLGALRPKADVVIDLILNSGAQAESLMEAFRGVAGRVVAASSMDVYRACGVLHGSEEGLPMIYGPGDRLCRFHLVLKRIDDGRRAILLEEGWAAWRSPRGYVENVAAALALAAVSGRAAGRVYNVAETPAFTELEWAGKIAAATGWEGKFVTLLRERTPAHLVPPGNSAQHWEAVSTRIRDELGWREAVPVDKAIQRTIAWERANPPGELSPAQFDYAAEDAALSGGGA